MQSTCYSYICMAVAASLQMGLFNDSFKGLLEEMPMGRTIFSALFIADTYVTLALGLPRTLREIDSQYSLPTAEQPMDLRNKLYGMYMNAKLTQILASIIETNHPFTRRIETKSGIYGVEYSEIVATEVRMTILVSRRQAFLTYAMIRQQETLDKWFKELQEHQSTGDASEDADVMR